ncbi:unnamed protein product [Chironomus riparius]|uniref:Uncharacterized protein n=1 Tax=Chironomus riparius TaxID=315576 RepID=A0A9N9S8B2_9DIPT|nr:unnamed protein product [Chironomus riparius]
MKVLLLIVAAFCIFGPFALADKRPVIKLCPSCSSSTFAPPDSDCHCVFGSPILRRYACGPACDAIGLCCEKKIVDPSDLNPRTRA